MAFSSEGAAACKISAIKVVAVTGDMEEAVVAVAIEEGDVITVVAVVVVAGTEAEAVRSTAQATTDFTKTQQQPMNSVVAIAETMKIVVLTAVVAVVVVAVVVVEVAVAAVKVVVVVVVVEGVAEAVEGAAVVEIVENEKTWTMMSRSQNLWWSWSRFIACIPG